MTNPSVFCLMLTADRQAFAERAVRCFLRQTYENRRLLIYDTGLRPFLLSHEDSRITVIRLSGVKRNIGQARNRAMSWATSHDDIVCHWDDDDWSGPERIADQVRLLAEIGADAVGYREMLFADTRNSHKECTCADDPESGDCPLYEPTEAWLYRNTDPRYMISTSLCYWRKTWERVHFADTQVREWKPFLSGDLKTVGVSANNCDPVHDHGSENVSIPAMIAEIHGSNTCAHESLNPQGVNRDGSPAWTRVPEWDATVKNILEAA